MANLSDEALRLLAQNSIEENEQANLAAFNGRQSNVSLYSQEKTNSTVSLHSMTERWFAEYEQFRYFNYVAIISMTCGITALISTTYIVEKLRQYISECAHLCCGYCQTQQRISICQWQNQAENLCLACPQCNRYKYLLKR